MMRALRRQALHCVFERAEALLARESVEVVEHDRNRRGVAGERVRELVDGGGDRAAGRAQPAQRRPAEARPDAIDGGRQIRPEARRIVVGGIERDPGDRGPTGSRTTTARASSCRSRPAHRRASARRRRSASSNRSSRVRTRMFGRTRGGSELGLDQRSRVVRPTALLGFQRHAGIIPSPPVSGDGSLTRVSAPGPSVRGACTLLASAVPGSFRTHSPRGSTCRRRTTTGETACRSPICRIPV